MKILSRIAKAVIPRSVKRTAFLAAVFMAIEHSRGVDKARFEEFNKQLKLVNDVKTLYLLEDFIERVWTLLPLSEADEPSKVCQKVMAWVPSWMLYAKEKVMIRDISRALVCTVRR